MVRYITSLSLPLSIALSLSLGVPTQSGVSSSVQCRARSLGLVRAVSRVLAFGVAPKKLGYRVCRSPAVRSPSEENKDSVRIIYIVRALSHLVLHSCDWSATSVACITDRALYRLYLSISLLSKRRRAPRLHHSSFRFPSLECVRRQFVQLVRSSWPRRDKLGVCAVRNSCSV